MSCYNNKGKKVGYLSQRFTNELLSNKVKKDGKFVKGAISVEAQESLKRMHQAIESGLRPENLTLAESIILDAVDNAITHQDVNLMNEMIGEIKTLKLEGKLEVEKQIEARQAQIDKISKVMAEDTSRIGGLLSETKKSAANMIEAGEADPLTVQLLAKDVGINLPIDNFDSGVEMARYLHNRLAKREKSPWARLGMKGLGRSLGSLSTWGYKDLEGVLNTISRGAGKESVLIGLIDEKLREGNETAYRIKDDYTVKLGKLIEKHYGLKPKTFKGKRAKIDETNHYLEVLRAQALNTANTGSEIHTGKFDEFGSEITLEKGELMQLYIDSLDGDVMAAMTRAGIDEETLLKLSSAHLTDADRNFAMALVREFYPEMYNQENEVYKKVYFTSMPKSSNYAGAISYQEETQDVEYSVDANQNLNRLKTNVTLNNAIEREVTGTKKLNLHRNIFSNLTSRMENSAKFIGGAEIYGTVATAWDSAAVKNSVKIANAYDYHTEVKNKIAENFGFYEPKVGKLHPAINWLKGNFVLAALASKIKLMFTQVLSSALWFIEPETWAETHPDLVDLNIAELIYNESATLRNRYIGDNLINLDANIKASAYDDQSLFKSKWDHGKASQKFREFNMLATKVGDGAGIMWGGTRFFNGAYTNARNQGLSHEAAVKQAIGKFNRKWQKAQQSYEAIDRADIQKGIWSIFTMFLTSPFQLGRQTFDSIRQIKRHLSKTEQGKGSPGYQFARLGMYHVYSSMSYQFIVSTLPSLLLGDDEKKDESLFELLWSGFRGPWINSVFILGDIYNAAENAVFERPWDTEIGRTAAFTSLNKARVYLTKLYKLTSKPNLTPKEQEQAEILRWNAMIELAQVTGAPTKSYGLFRNKEGVIEIQAGIEKILNGDADIETLLRFLGYSNYVVQSSKGTRKKRKKGSGSLENIGDIDLDLNIGEIDFGDIDIGDIEL